MTYVDRIRGLTSGVAYKAPVNVATTGPITLSGLQTVDGTALSLADRVLVKDQANAVDNGIWLASTGAWSRAVDCDGSRDVVPGTQVLVLGGTANGGSVFYLTTTGDITVGVSALSWAALDLAGALLPSGSAFDFIAWNGAAGSLVNTGSDIVATDMTHLQAILAAGRIARLDPSATYTLAAPWTIPDDAVIVGDAQITYTGDPAQTWLTIGVDCCIESLRLVLPDVANPSTYGNVLIGSGYRGRKIEIRGGGDNVTGTVVRADSDFEVNSFDSEGCGRPLVLADLAADGSAKSHARIGNFRVRNHIRAFKTDNYSDWIVGNVDIRTLHAGAVQGTSGQNHFLIGGGANFHVLGGYMEGSSEHSIRIAGDGAYTVPYGFSFSNLIIDDPYKSAIKVNADLYCSQGLFSNILLIGRQTSSYGGNQDFFRLSHCRDITVENCRAVLASGATYTCACVFSVNDVDGITARNVTAEGVRSRAFLYDGDQDTGEGLGGGPCANITLIGVDVDLTATTNDAAIKVTSTESGETFGNFAWIGGRITLPSGVDIYNRGGTGGLEASTRRAIQFVEIVSPTSPDFVGADADEFHLFLNSETSSYSGPNSGFSLAARGRQIIGTEGFDAGEASQNAAGLFLTSPDVTPGPGAVGSAVIWSRPGAARRGAAVSILQDTANTYETTLAFYVGANATGTDVLQQKMTLNHDHTLNLTAASAKIQIDGTTVLKGQQAAISDVPTAGAATAADNATAINEILAMARAHGLIAT